MKPPTILPSAVAFFFASTGIFPHGYFTEKKKKSNKCDFIALNSQQAKTESHKHLQWSFVR